MNEESKTTCLPDDVWPIGKKAAILTAIVVAGLGLLDFMHRQILASVLPLIRQEWHITDTQAGMLISIVNIALVILILPSAYLIDNWSRKKMLAIMAGVWSLATGISAIATNFTQLLIFRFFLGAGEAGYNPAAAPLLASSFPKKLKATAISITQIGATLGVPLGTVYGAYAGTAFGWRNAFVIAMVPGLILSVLALFIHDYKTVKNIEENAHKASWLVSILEIIRTPSLICVIIAAVAYYFFAGTQMNWLPTYFVREGNLSLQQSSIYSSIVLGSCVLSTILTGPIMDFARKFSEKFIPVILAVGLITGTMLYQTGFLMCSPGSIIQVVLFSSGNFIAGLLCAGTYICIVSVTKPGVHATAISLVLFSQNVLGFALGPLVAGILSDNFGIGSAMQFICFSPAISGVMYVGCSIFYKKDVEKAGCQDFSF